MPCSDQQVAAAGTASNSSTNFYRVLAASGSITTKAYLEVMVLAWLGDTEAATARLERMVSEGAGNSATLYDAACAAAQAALPANATRPDQGLSDAMRKRSLQLLAAAVEAGYRDGDHLRSDADLAPLHTEPKFRQLVARLAPPARFATLLRADVKYESRLLSELSVDEHSKQSAQLVAEGYRPVRMSVAVVPNDRPQVSSVWHRPLIAEDAKEQLAIRQSNGVMIRIRSLRMA